MGYMFARDLAETIPDLEVAVHTHLRHNCYPPVPVEMIEPAVEAILACQDGLAEERVALPDGVRHRVWDDACPAGVLLTELHLEAFVDWETA